MSTTLVFATNNAHKVSEMQLAVGSVLRIISLHAAGISIDIPEPHDTLEANAAEKSGTIYRLTGLDCFGEDTGLETEALHGEPGVHSARYAGDERSFEKNIDLLLARLQPHANRSARFRTVISLRLHGQSYLFEGICAGRIAASRTGNGGFGYDPVFLPEGSNRSFGEMTPEEKNVYSHRKKAADQLIRFLQTTVPITS